MTTYDCIVVGLGGMGSAAIAHLARRGKRVIGLEQFAPAHDRGSSHGGSRIVRQSYYEDLAYVPLLQRAYTLWEALGRDADADVLTLTGGLYLGPEASATFGGSLKAAQHWQLPHEVLDAAAVRRRFPTFTPAPAELALFEEHAGFVRPEKAVLAHLDLAARAGAELRFGERVGGWEADGDEVRVDTGTRRVRAESLVVTAGPWAPRLLRDLRLPLRVERRVQFWFDPPAGTSAFAPDRHPVFLAEHEHGEQVYGFPAIDGPTGGVKAAFFANGRETDPDSLDRVVTAAEAEEMRARLRLIVPGLPGRLHDACACMYTSTPDQHFVIAPHPSAERVFIAAGFSGHGFKFVPVVGEIMADLVVDGSTAHDIGLFDPGRFGVGHP